MSTEEGYAGLMRDRAIAAGELPPDCHAPNPCPTPDLCGGLCACQWPDEHDDTPKTPVAPVAHHLKRRMDVVANGDCECGHAPDSHLGKTGACMVADCLCISFDLDLGE